MLELTFGEQVKIVLSRKGMTIKQLAEMIEERTGKKMSRQNLTQRLSRDNFQEQDMRLIASILECPFYLSIMEENVDSEHISHDTFQETVQETVHDKTADVEKSVDAYGGNADSVDAGRRYEDSADAVSTDADNVDAGGIEGDIMDAEAEQLTLNLEIDEPQVKDGDGTKEQPEELSGNERDITIGELVDIHDQAAYEEAVEDTEESSYDVESEYADAEYADAEYADSSYGDEPECEESEYTDAEYADSAYADESEYDETEYTEASYGDEPEYENAEEKTDDVNEILEEVAAIEAEEKRVREEKERVQEKEQEKPRGWRAYLQRRKKKQAEPVHEDKPYEPEEQAEEEAEELTAETQQEERYQEEEQGYDEYVQENAEEIEEEFADTTQDWEAPSDENVGEINPYTGLEYESNSVRVHPKRIGYVQVYDRTDHQWTDMTEWAFLGYQERKKALLGKDYEPPIYLD